MRATKVVSGREKLYIVKALKDIAYEVPVAGPMSDYILQYEMDDPKPDTEVRYFFPSNMYGGEHQDTQDILGID